MMPKFPPIPACVAILLAASALPGHCFTAEVVPAMLKPLEGATVTVSTEGKAATGDVSGIAFQSISDKPTFDRLQGTRARLDFSRPVTLEKIALLRIGWADWALPGTVRLSINGQPPQVVTLSAPRISPGKYLPAGALPVDVVSFGKPLAVSQLAVEVAGAAPERGTNTHGTIRIAIPAQPPLFFGLTEKDAVPPDATGLKFEVECAAPVPAPYFKAVARQFRVARNLGAPLPPFPGGKSTHTVRWSELGADFDAPAPVSPLNFYDFGLESAKGEPEWKLVSWSYLRDAKSRLPGALDSVPPRAHPADAQGWREGIPAEGFGRFGWVQNSGLLTGTLLVDGLANATGVDGSGKPLKTASWKIECGNATVRVWERSIARWTSIRHRALYAYSSEIQNELAVKEPGLLGVTRTPQTLTGSILAPGILIDSDDPQMALTLAREPDAPEGGWILHATPEGLKKSPAGEQISGETLAEGWIVASWPGAESSPLLLAFKKRPKSIELANGRLTVRFFGALERIGAGFPLGYVSRERSQAARAPSKGELAERARQMAAILRAYPAGVTQRFREREGEIEIEEVTRHLDWENDWNEPAHPVAPLSPLLVFAAAQGYPARLPDGLNASFDWPTKYGPYRFAEGNTITYRLPVPPWWTRLYAAPVPAEPLAEAIGQEISDPAKAAKLPLSSDSLASFKNWASSSLALPLMPAPRREAFLAAWRAKLELTFGAQAWYLRKEPFSGAAYPVSFAWVEPNTFTLADVNSGLGAALYSLYAYACSSGDWEFARAKWPKAAAAMEYFLMEHDWCQMQTAAREHSGSSAIDMDCIGYQGVLAYARLAEKLGLEDEAAYGRFLLARVALPTCVRWLGNRWVNPQAGPANLSSLGIGLSENTGFDLMSSRLDPDYVNSQAALMLSWLGQFPEVYDVHLWGTGRKFFDGFERDFMERKMPDWRKNWPGNRNNHPANICAHLYLRALLGFPGEELRGELKKQAPWGLAPRGEVARENAPFYALLLAGDCPAILRDWGTAKPEGFQYDRQTRTATLRFSSARPEKLVLETRVPAKSLRVNEKNAPVREENGLISIDLPPGNGTVALEF